jgi:hypothetical protein
MLRDYTYQHQIRRHVMCCYGVFMARLPRSLAGTQ